MKKVILLFAMILVIHVIPHSASRALPNDPYLDAQWGWFAVGADVAWSDGITGKGVVVAVIDTGVDYNHPELNNSIWHNPDEIPDNGIDDDGNGYVDDYIGWDFVDNDSTPMDTIGHGTMVASVIAAEANNDMYYAGVAPDAKIMVIRAITPYSTDETIAAAIKYAVDNGADIISMSFGSGCWSVDDVYGEVLKYAYEHNVLLVAAAGNERTGVGYPASNKYVIAVSAVDKNMNPESYTCYGPEVDVAGPGNGNFIYPNSTMFYTAYGTSFAAPFVSGVAALVKSKYPDITVDELRQRIVYHAKDIYLPGKDLYTGYGLAYAPNALATEYMDTWSLMMIVSTVIAVVSVLGSFLYIRRHEIKNAETVETEERKEESTAQ